MHINFPRTVHLLRRTNAQMDNEFPVNKPTQHELKIEQ